MLVLEVTGLDLDSICEEPRTGDVRHSLADISKAIGAMVMIRNIV